MEPLATCLVLAAGLAAGAPKDPPPAAPYVRHCARCHGLDGGGRGARQERLPGGRISDAGRLASREEAALVRLVLEGRGAMPGFRGKLKPEEARALVRQVLDGSAWRR